MKKYKLDKEEKQILKDYEAGKYVSVDNLDEEIERAKQAARNTLLKTKNINIRLSLRNIQELKAKSIETGLPYQTLAAAVLRQYINEKIKLSL